MVNFGIVYGLSAYGLADRLQIEQEEAQRVHRRATSSASRRCKEFIERRSSSASRGGPRGHAVRPHPARAGAALAPVPDPQLGERLAVNMVIQGTAADIIKVAMVRARDELRPAG